MILSNILNKANSVSGAFLDLGYGKGKDCKEIYNLMFYNQIKKRDFYLVDTFRGGSNGVWQNAHDQVNEVKNRLKTKAEYIKVNLGTESLNLKSKIGIVNLDLEQSTLHGLKLAFNNINKGGVIILRDYNNPEVSSQIQKFLIDNKLLSKVSNEGEYSYIIVEDSVKTISHRKLQRTRSVLT